MKVEVISPPKEFKPVTIQITFENEGEIKPKAYGFVGRFDDDNDECHSRMSKDFTCQKIREALRIVGY